MECVAVVGLVALALLADSREDGIGPWLGQLTFLGFAAYRLLPTLQQAFVAIVRIRADRAGFAAIAADLRLARARPTSPSQDGCSWNDRPGRKSGSKRSHFAMSQIGPRARRSIVAYSRACSGRLHRRERLGKNDVGRSDRRIARARFGRIEIDGIALDDANRDAWQSRIAYVPQNIFLLDTTIAQNVALGIPAGAIDRQRLFAAARLAQLDEFIATLPGGYEHRVGERGVRLSGGQRQRIGIARALYAEASVLILDEATNALDGLTEQELMATIVRLRGRYTVIVIAHRLSTVRACDVIFELDRGQIRDSGTYADLIRTQRRVGAWPTFIESGARMARALACELPA